MRILSLADTVTGPQIRMAANTTQNTLILVIEFMFALLSLMTRPADQLIIALKESEIQKTNDAVALADSGAGLKRSLLIECTLATNELFIEKLMV